MKPTTKTWTKSVISIALALTATVGLSADLAQASPRSNDAEIFYQQGYFAEAFEIWENEASKGDPVAQFNLATLYETGRGVDRDPAKARMLLIKSASRNYAPALHNLALIQFEEDRPHKALEYLQKAVDQKFTASLYTLGKFYQFGIPVETKPKLAFQYIGMAAEAGHIQAQYNLGKMYRDGFGIARNEEASSHWFLRAAEQGNQKAQDKIAQRYASGTGVKKNEVLALKWALVTGQNISQDSHDLKDQLLKHLSVKEIEQAKKDASAFTAKKEHP